MMSTSTTQSLFEADLAQMARDHDLRLANDRQWANTGTYRLLPEQGFKPVLVLTYNWQNDGSYVSITATPAVLSRSTRAAWRYDELDDLEREIVRFLSLAAPAEREWT